MLLTDKEIMEITQAVGVSINYQRIAKAQAVKCITEIERQYSEVPPQNNIYITHDDWQKIKQEVGI